MVEEENCLAYRHPVLRSAETEYVDAALPCEVRRGAAKAGARIGEAGSIHMEPYPMLLANRGKRAQFVNRVDAASFGRLANRHGARLGKVNILPVRCDLLKSRWSQLSIDALGNHQLGAIGEKLRGTAFVGLHVGRLTADDRVIRLAEGSQRQRICRGPIEGKENLAVGLKQPPESIRRGCSPGVVSIRRDVATICRRHSRPCFRADAGIVVTRKLLQKSGAIDIGHMSPIFGFRADTGPIDIAWLQKDIEALQGRQNDPGNPYLPLCF